MFNYNEGSDNEFLNLWNVDSMKESNIELSLEYFQQQIDNGNINGYYHYDGSFTTPGCDEVVNWIVFKNPLLMSKA